MLPTNIICFSRSLLSLIRHHLKVWTMEQRNVQHLLVTSLNLNYYRGTTSVDKLPKRPGHVKLFSAACWWTRFNGHQISQLCDVWLCWNWKSVKLVVVPSHFPVLTWSVFPKLRYMMFVKQCSPTRWRKKLDVDVSLELGKLRTEYVGFRFG